MEHHGLILQLVARQQLWPDFNTVPSSPSLHPQAGLGGPESVCLEWAPYCSMKAIFTDVSSWVERGKYWTEWERTQPWASNSISKSHSLGSSFLLFIFLLPPPPFTVQYGMLALRGGWCALERLYSHVSHSSHVSPISYTLQEREGERWRERVRKKGGGGEEEGIWYALCMSDLYKTKRGHVDRMYARETAEHSWICETKKKKIIIYFQIFLSSFASRFTG